MLTEKIVNINKFFGIGMKEETDDMKRSVKMLFGLALGLTIGSMCSIELGIMALPLCGCVGMAIGLILGTNNKEDK